MTVLGLVKRTKFYLNIFLVTTSILLPYFFVPTFRSFLQTVMSYFTWCLNESTPTSHEEHNRPVSLLEIQGGIYFHCYQSPFLSLFLHQRMVNPFGLRIIDIALKLSFEQLRIAIGKPN